jgi:hypothetical protein
MGLGPHAANPFVLCLDGGVDHVSPMGVVLYVRKSQLMVLVPHAANPFVPCLDGSAFPTCQR